MLRGSRATALRGRAMGGCPRRRPVLGGRVAVSYGWDGGRQQGQDQQARHYGLGVVRLEYTDDPGDPWTARELTSPDMYRQLPLAKTFAVATDPHRVNRIYVGTAGAGVAVGIRRRP